MEFGINIMILGWCIDLFINVIHVIHIIHIIHIIHVIHIIHILFFYLPYNYLK